MRPSTSSSISSSSTASSCSAPSIVPCPLPKLCDTERSIHACVTPFSVWSREGSVVPAGMSDAEGMNVDGIQQRRKRRNSWLSGAGIGEVGVFEDDTDGLGVRLGLEGVGVGMSNGDISMGLGEGCTPAEIDFRKRLSGGDVLMSMGGMGEEDASVHIGKSALFPGQYWMSRNSSVMMGSDMREDSIGHPQSASPTRGVGSGIGVITSPMGHGGLGLGLGNDGMSTLGLETISPSMISPPLASFCPPTASLAQLGGMLVKSEDNAIESWRDAQSSSGSASGSSLPVSPIEGISPRMLGGFAGDFYQPGQNYGPYPDVITHQSPISATAATATTQMPNYYQPGHANTPAQYIGWDAAPPPMLATGRTRTSFGGESSDGAGDGGRVLLGGANAKVPEDRQRQRVVQACEKCRERKAACNGHVPCKRCTDKKLACVYAPVRRMRGPNKVKKAPGSRKESMAAAKAAKAKAGGGVGLMISTRRPSGGVMGHIRRASDMRHQPIDVKMEEPPLTSGTRGESYSPSEPTEMGTHGYGHDEHEYSGEATSASTSTPMMATPAGFLHNQITGGYHGNGGGDYGMEEHTSPLLKSAPSRPSQLPTSPMVGQTPFRNYPGSTKIQPMKRLPGSPGDAAPMYQAMTVPIPGPNAAFVTSYFEHQPNPQPYAYSTSYDGASHIPDSSTTRYQFGAQAGNQLGYPGPAYSASHPTSVSFSTMYTQRAGTGNGPQQSPLSPGSASRSLYPTPMTGSQATLLESPMGEDPPVVGLGVHGATYSLPAQSNVRSMAIGSSRVASGGSVPAGPSHSPLGLVGTSPRVDAHTPGIWGAGSGAANTSSPYAGGSTSVDEGVEMNGGVFDSDKADSMAATPDRVGWGEQGTYFNEASTTGRWS